MLLFVVYGQIVVVFVQVNIELMWLCIGLVFLGGGVCGYVYIGVFKMLECMCIFVDVIVVMSMGVVVGGLYVSGMCVDVLEQKFLQVDLSDIVFDCNDCVKLL